MRQFRPGLTLLALFALLLLAACGGDAPTTGGQGSPTTQAAAATQPAATEPAATQPAEATQPAATEPAAATQPTDSTQAAGGDALERIKSKGTLVVGTSADYPPYESVDEGGNFVGFDMDLIREVGKRLGVEVQIQDMAFDALIASLQEGKIDAIMAAMQATPEREERVDFSQAYNHPKDAFLVAGDAELTLNTPADIAGLNIGVQTGSAQEKWVLENLVETGLMSQDQVFSYERADQGAQDVAAGRIDVLMLIGDVGRELAEQEGLKVALETSETIAAGQAIAMPQGSTALKAEIDRILAELEQEGFITSLREKYNIP